MTKKDLVKTLDNGVIKCKIDGSIKQYTRQPELTGLTEDINENTIDKSAIKSLDSGADIGVFDLISSTFTTVTNADMDDILSISSDCCE
jgi:hypothetical protein